MSDIGKALEKLYESERIILWYDDKEELREEFQSLDIDGVTPLEGELPPLIEVGASWSISLTRQVSPGLEGRPDLVSTKATLQC